MAADGNTVWVPILPSMKGFGPALDAGTAGVGAKAGKKVGDEFAAGIEASKAKVEKASAAMVASRNKEADAAGKLRVAEANLQDLVDKGITSGKQHVKAVEAVATAQRNSTTASDKAKASVAALAAAEEAATKAAKNLGTESSSASKQVGELATSTDKAESSLGKFGMLAAAGAGLAYLGGKAMDAGKAFIGIGETFANVNKTLQFTTGATGEKLDGMMESVKNIGKASPKSFGEIGEVLAKLSQRTGLTGTDLEYLTKQVMKTNAVMGQDTDINGLTAAFAAFGIQGKDTSAALDELFKASRATGVGVNELAAQAVKGAPQFQQFGMSIGESAALMGSLDKAGINSDAVLTGLNKAMIKFADTGRPAKQALNETISAIEKFAKAGDEVSMGKATDLAASLFGSKGAGQFVNAVKSGAITVEGLTAAMDENQKSVMDAGGAIPTLSSAWALFKNNAIIAIEPAATKVFGIFIEGLTWFRTTGVKAIQSVISIFQDLLNGPLSPLIDIFTNVKDTVVLFFNAMTGGETDMSLPWAQTVIDVANRVKDGFNEVRGGFIAFKDAFVGGGDEVTKSGLAGFLQQLGIYARDIADAFQNYVVPPLKTFGEVLLTAGEIALPLVLGAVILVKDILVGLGEAVFAVVNFFKDHDTAARVLAITVGTILLPTMVAMSVELVKQAILWTRTVVALTAYIIKGQILAARAKIDAAITAASWVGAQIKILAGWVSTAAGAVASFVSKTAGAVVQAALTSSAWIGVQGRIAAGWIATKVTAVTSFIGKAASATAQAAVTSAIWLGSQAKIAAGWTAAKISAIASYVATSASATLEAVKSSAAWVAANARTAASFLATKISMLAVATATGLMTAAQWLLNAAMNANPFSLIVIALVAVGAGLYMLWTKSETFRNIVTGAFNAVKNVVMGVWNWVSENWPLLLAILTGPIGMAVLLITKNWDTIKEGVTAVKDWIVEKFNGVVGFITGLPGKISSAASGMWDGIMNAFKGAINYIIRAWNALEFKIPGFSFGTVKWEGFTLGLPDIPMLASGGIAGRTKDGKLWGPGTSTSDSILGLDKRGLPTALVSTDEGVVMADAMANGGAPLVAALNRGWTPSAGDLHAMFPDLPRFKDGTAYGPQVYQPKKKSAFAGAQVGATAQTSAFAGAQTQAQAPASGPKSTFYKDLYGNGSTPAPAPAQVTYTAAPTTANSGGTSGGTSMGGSGGGTGGGAGGTSAPSTGTSTGVSTGGGHGTAAALTKFARGIEGATYRLGGWGNGWMTDCSGAAAALANFATQGLGAGSGQRFATGNEGAALKAMGAVPGVGPAGSLSFGWYNGGPYGGHTAATLPDGTNVEMGGARGNGQFGGSAVGANWSQFTDHMHFPPEFFVGGDELPGTNIGTGYGTYAGADTSGVGASGTSGASGASSSGGSSGTSGSMSLKAYAGQTASSFASEMTGDTLDFFGLGALADAPIFPVQETTADLTISPTAGTGGDTNSAPPATGGNGGPLINLENVETFDLDELVRRLFTELNHAVRSDAISIGGWR